ncbi:iron ABC transporter substrate-binding protein [Helicobacter sp. 12S02634-8]|uniref:ABC transporter substrate-binding protein n=1 Tax=Helicobacter sp. 12S02634-8 TaxID=1476199 RepID=UPI000BA7264F|nr:ABC transporter substrate-binding protein [Helicobacter sp. 12S02634-8]PAF47506.1 iron ABC transporter substrate-binding protein [Helicobacter sp. 12S02634-8]
MRKVFFIGFLVFSSLLWAQTTQSNAAAANDSLPITIKDYFGPQTFTKPINRVIYLGSYAEVPAMLGIWDKVVGMADYGFKSDIVKATATNLSQIQKLSDDHYAALNIEALKKLSPDLIITYVGNPQSIEFAKKFGIKFLSFQDRSVRGVIKDISLQAQVFQKQAQAAPKIAKMEEILTLIADRTKHISSKKRVIEIFHKPNQVSGKESLDSDIMALADVDNLGLKLVDHGRSEVSLERIISANPEIIFIWWLSPYTPKDLLENPQFSTITAIKNRQVYKLPPIDIGGPRTPLISLFIATKAYPEAFKDIDINGVLLNYYQSIFGLTKAQIQPFLW